MPSVPIRVAAVCAVAGALLLGGCETIKSRERLDTLNRVVRVYEKAVRWGRLDAARALVRPRDDAAPAVEPADIENYQVTASSSQILQVTDDSREATVSMSFDYRPPASVVVHTHTQVDVWWYDEETEGWYVDGSLPRFAR